jgi:hypothetical protein
MRRFITFAPLLPGSEGRQPAGRQRLAEDRHKGDRVVASSRTISPGTLRERLAKLVKGPVLGAGDPAYEESRRVFNAMIERRPAAILRCSCAEDVAHGVTVAREYGLPISIKATRSRETRCARTG